jgi:hypothetical protein
MRLSIILEKAFRTTLMSWCYDHSITMLTVETKPAAKLCTPQ